MKVKGQVYLLICYLAACSANAELSDKISIHGFASQGYMVSDRFNYQTFDSEGRGTYQFNEFGINVNLEHSVRLRGGIQLLMREYGYIGDSKPSIDWAYAEYLLLNQLGIRTGRIKSPLGLYNESRDIDMARTSILLPQSLYNESMRSTTGTMDGLGLYGSMFTRSTGRLSYNFCMGYIEFAPDNSGTYYHFDGGDQFDFKKVKHKSKLNYAAAISWTTPLDGLRFGFSFSEYNAEASQPDLDAHYLVYAFEDLLKHGYPFDTVPVVAESATIETHKYRWYVLSSEYITGNLTLSAEAFYRKGVILMTAYNVTIPISLPIYEEDMDVEAVGGYLGAGYRFNDWFELGTYYSTVDDLVTYRQSHDVALSARFDVTENWLFKIEGHYLQGNLDIYGPEKIPADDESWNMFSVKTTFSF